MAKKILIVDDESDIVAMLESILKRRGYNIVTALDGESCLKKASDEKPDLILLDIVLPDINGFEICKRLKEDEKTKDIRVVILTALSEEKDLSKGLEEGAYSFISKPFAIADLLDKVKDVLNEKDN